MSGGYQGGGLPDLKSGISILIYGAAVFAGITIAGNAIGWLLT